MANYKTVPNQKVVKVQKELCNKQNIYAAINIDAMESAARALDAGAFKLWVYFAKNQDGYEFALSSKEVEVTFGMKIKQYNNAVDNLIEAGYLVRQGDSNTYHFNEKPVITKEDNEETNKNSLMPKGNNAVITKKDNAVITKSNNALLPQGIRNNTNTTLNNTIDNTDGIDKTASLRSAVIINSVDTQKEKLDKAGAVVLTSKEALSKYGVAACANKIASGYAGYYWINGELVQLV